MPNNAPKVDPSDVRSLIDPDTLRILDRMADREFMKPVLDYGDCWECETSNGEGFVVPSDVHPIPDHLPEGWYGDEAEHSAEDIGESARALLERLLKALGQYMGEGCSGEVQSAKVRRGVYLCRLSAPGYMDCTEWEAHDTAQGAADSLADSASLDDED